MKGILNNCNNFTDASTDYNIEIPDNLLEEWQSIVDLLAHIGGACAGLIMKVQNDEIEVFVSSNSSNNPYQVGTKEPLTDSGLYCEAVINKDEKLFVRNALKSKEWENNPDMKYNLVCYLGFPIKLPNGKPFGTICILDDKENNYSTDIINLMEKMRNLIEAHLKLLYLSFHDSLTSTYNRTFFATKVMQEMKRAEQHKLPLTMLLLDIDEFKHINDVFGHLTGDMVLKNIAHIMTSSIHCSNIVVRYGGEEFIILMPETPIKEAATTAEKIRTTVENSQILDTQKVTISIGVAEWIYNESLDDWYKRADKALYYAKENGRNQVVISTNETIEQHSI